MWIPTKIGIKELLEIVFISNFCVALAKKKRSLIVNIKGLQREREVPRYNKCICDHQKNGECILNERRQSFYFTRRVNKLSI